MKYAITCARCDTRRVFRSVSRLSAWVALHRCWESV